MNSNFTLKDDEDLLSYDFCAESYLNEELNKSRNRTCGSSLSEVVHIFIQPSILAYQVDPVGRVPISKDVAKLEVEPHMITISTEAITQQLLELEKRLEDEEDESFEVDDTCGNSPDINANDNIQLKKPPASVPTSSTPLASVKRSLIRPRSYQPLIRVRLKSNEIIKVPKSILMQLRREAAKGLLQKDNEMISIQKIPPEALLPQPVGLPFSDRLSGALKRISVHSMSSEKTPSKNPVSSYFRGQNGKVTKTVRLRAALDKSTIAWSSTTRLKPKTSLVDQLTALGSSFSLLPEQDKNADPNAQETPTAAAAKGSRRSANLVPVVIKIRSSASKTKMMPLRTALQQISNDTLGKPLIINGSHGDSVASSFHRNST